MKPFQFHYSSALAQEFNQKIARLEFDGVGHLEGLLFLEQELSKMIEAGKSQNSEFESEAKFPIENMYRDLKKYIRERTWYEKFGYEPRTKESQYDFSRFREGKKGKPLPEQKAYWATILEEFGQFSGVSSFVSSEFRDAAENELRQIEAELALDAVSSSKRLVWNRKPSEFGHLFHELHSKGWISLQGGGEINFSEFARVSMVLFEFERGTTTENLANELNPARNTLPDSERERFKIPFPEEMNPPKRKRKK